METFAPSAWQASITFLKLGIEESSYKQGFLGPPFAPLWTTVASIVIKPNPPFARAP